MGRRQDVAQPRASVEEPPRALALLAIVALVLAGYAGTVGSELVQDDRAWIPALPALRNPFDLAAIFGTRFFGELRAEDVLWRPITTWTLACNWAANRLLGLEGAHPAGFQVVDLALHAAAAWMVYRFLRTVAAGSVALAAALVFAAHPIQTEAVAAIVNRSEALGASLGLAFLVLHRRGRTLGAAACYLLAMGSKESAVAFGALAIWVDVVLPQDAWRKRFPAYAAYATTALVWLAARAAVIGDTRMAIPFVSNPIAAASTGERILTAAAVQLLYLRRLVWPVGLSSDYSYAQIAPAQGPADPRVLGFVLVFALAVAAAWRWRRSHPVIALAVGGYAVLFAPTSNFVVPIGTILAERLAYAPSLFAVALAVSALRAWLPGRAWVAAIAIVLAVLVPVTWLRARTWKDERTFFTEQVRSAPSSAAAHYNAGAMHAKEGELVPAIAEYRRALEILPDYLQAWNALGMAQAQANDLDGARASFERSIAIEPRFARGHYGLGQCRQIQGDLAAAAAAYEEALRLDPGYLHAYAKLGEVYARLGRSAEARALWEEALRRNPDYEPARRLLGR